MRHVLFGVGKGRRDLELEASILCVGGWVGKGV